jgi:hypothetical protein
MKYRTVSIASDGEAKRGDALVILTMSSQLSEGSPIYTQLQQLELMNLLVGPDDITADKDFKHVIKRQRNIFMRNKGVEIQGLCITPSILRLHLKSNGVSSHRLQSLLNPNDKQDVILAYSLLKEIWSLPPPPPDSSPAFACARSALNLYGRFAQNLVLPYVCIDFNLAEQLISLSAATHLAFHLYRDNSARTRFMPTQSYVDIVLMVKNVYFCVAKMKADNPTGNFYLTLLGTDRLETLFGLIRTAVGTDSNVDTLQLGSRASGLTEVAVILAEHPEWDHGTRRLTLPAISREAGEITSKADHISPKDWRGDVGVANVNLHTCWLLGRKRAVELIPEAEPLMNALVANQVASKRVDMLSPFGQLLVNQRDETQEYDCSDLSDQYPPDKGHLTPPSVPFTHEGDLEDAIADEMPRNQVSSEVVIQGQKTSKAKALRHRMAYQASRSSTDRLKRVQQLPCFDTLSSAPSDSDLIAQVITSSESDLGAPSLRIGNPFAVLVRCEGLIVLAVAQVNRLKFAGRDDLNELPLHLLVDPTARVDSQILRLLPATLDDDPTQVHDWCWSLQMEASCDNISGQHVHPVNPSVSIQRPGKPTFLFESTFLVTLSCGLFQQLQPEDRKSLPAIQRSESFPYRNSGVLTACGLIFSFKLIPLFPGQACFVCEIAGEISSTGIDGQSDCSMCGPSAGLNWKNTQRVLEHMGAHILYDAKLNTSEERCGLCLRPAPMCHIYLKKGRDAQAKYSVDQKKSNCPNLVRFNYMNAATSSESSPCSNVPVVCPLCPTASPAVWTYSLHAHFRGRHRLTTAAHFPTRVQLSQSERDGMHRVWKARFKQHKSYRSKKKLRNPPLAISQAHRSRLSIMYVFYPQSTVKREAVTCIFLQRRCCKQVYKRYIFRQ